MNTIEIRPDKDHGFRAYFNNIDCFDLVPYVERLSLWKEANRKLENDVEKIAKSFSDFEYGEYLWCFTWENHRNDGLIGTIYYYYIIDLIDFIHKSHKVERLIGDVNAPNELVVFLAAKLNVSLRKNGNRLSKKHLVTKLYKYLTPFKSTYPFFKHTFSKIEAPVPNQKIFVQMRDDFKKNRFSGALDHLNKEDIVVYNKFIYDSPRHHPFGKSEINFGSLFDLKILNQTVKIVSIIFKMLNKSKDIKELKRDNLFFSFVANQSSFQFGHLVMKTLLFDKAINLLQPKALFTVTSLADPISRMPISVAHRNNVKSYVIICRSMLSKLRAEDRASSVDINQLNNTALGDYFIVRDTFSENTLVSQGIPKAAIFYNIPKAAKVDAQKINVKNGIILLLTQFDNNQKLIDILAKCNLSKFSTIYLRSHPNRWKKNEVSTLQYQQLKATGLEIVDITDYKMNELEITESLAITTNSTSGVEIVGRGAPIVWMPFVTEHSLQFGEVMETLGKVCHEAKELIDFFENLASEPNFLYEFSTNCLAAFGKYFDVQNDIKSFSEHTI